MILPKRMYMFLEGRNLNNENLSTSLRNDSRSFGEEDSLTQVERIYLIFNLIEGAKIN